MPVGSDLQEILEAGASVINISGDALADGKLDWQDGIRNMGKLIQLPTQIIRAVENASSITLEQFDTEEEIGEIAAEFKALVELPEDGTVTEAHLQAGVKGLLNFVHLAALIGKAQKS